MFPYFRPRANQREELLRGRKIGTLNNTQNEVDNVRGSWDPGFWWCDLTLPYFEAQGHFCVVGSPGSGKTLVVRMMMESVMPAIGHWQKIPTQPPKPDSHIEVKLTKEEIARRQKLLDGPDDPREPFKLPFIPSLLGVTSISFIAHCYFAPPNTSAPWIESSYFVSIVGALMALSLGFLHLLHRGKAVVALQTLILLCSAIGLYFIKDQIEAGIVGFCALLLPFLAPPQPVPETKIAPEKVRTLAPESEVVSNPKLQDWYNHVKEWPLQSLPHRAFIYDGKLEVSGILNEIPGFKGQVFNMDPFHHHGYAWDIAKDIDGSTTAIQIATILIPEDKQSSNRFFPDAARTLMADTFKALHYLRPGNWSFRDAILILKNQNRLIDLLMACPDTADDVETFLSGHRDSVGDVMATIGVKIALYEPIAALWEKAMKEGRAISLTTWIQTESVLLVANDKARNSSLDAINRAIFNRSVELLLSQRPHDFQAGVLPSRTWFFLDEAREAGILEKLTSLMTTGRQYGACVVMAFQDIEGMRASFGEKEANEITGLCSYKAFLRIDSPQTASWASEVIGDYEALITKTSVSSGKNDSYTYGNSTSWNISSGKTQSNSESWSSGTSLSENEAAESSIVKGALASEFMSFPKPTKQTGIAGFFVTPFGAYRHVIKRFPTGNPKFERNIFLRPVDDQRMTQWDLRWDALRLGIQVAKTPEQLLAEKKKRDAQKVSQNKVNDHGI